MRFEWEEERYEVKQAEREGERKRLKEKEVTDRSETAAERKTQEEFEN
jgi:hypothetical protein